MEKETLKTKKGITLIALVITVVVLLILAGTAVTIGLSGGDLFGHANNAVEKWNTRVAEENAINEVWDMAKGIITVADDVLPTSAEGVAAGKPIQNPTSYGENPNAQATADGDDNYFALPNGFYYAGGSVDTGVVISDAPADENKGTDKAVLTGNQFVWVPVPVAISTDTSTISTSGVDLAANPDTVTPMAKLQSNKTDYEGLLYIFSGTTSTYQPTWNISNTNNREPALTSREEFDSSYSNYVIGQGITSPIPTIIELKQVYKNVVQSINQYGGFYVGRYELGLEGTNTVSKLASTTVTTADSTNTQTKSWYGLYAKAKEYDKSSITSTMIWGSQYDAMMNWMAKTGKPVGTVDATKKNLSQITGTKDEDIINNIFDLYGAHYECTCECGVGNGFNGRTYRGSYYEQGETTYAPGSRAYNDPYGSYEFYSTRLSLYINM